ncbi:transposase [Streptomyces sp. NPDC005065]|uniref:IS110 family transposase n=2 Tax=unclassified Streptomyces TaxID=2593676 RepID=UPI0033A1BF18
MKTDKVDARTLAQILAADFLPPVWLPDERTSRRRRLVAQRTRVVRQRTRIKNQVQSILHRNLMPRPGQRRVRHARPRVAAAPPPAGQRA